MKCKIFGTTLYASKLTKEFYLFRKLIIKLISASKKSEAKINVHHAHKSLGEVGANRFLKASLEIYGVLKLDKQKFIGD